VQPTRICHERIFCTWWHAGQCINFLCAAGSPSSDTNARRLSVSAVNDRFIQHGMFAERHLWRVSNAQWRHRLQQQQCWWQLPCSCLCCYVPRQATTLKGLKLYTWRRQIDFALYYTAVSHSWHALARTLTAWSVPLCASLKYLHKSHKSHKSCLITLQMQT